MELQDEIRARAFAEGSAILDAIAGRMPAEIDGREAIESMKAAESSNWKQMEWIGFYPEFWFATYLQDEFMAAPGPRYGNMSFDIKCEFVWDLKAHSTSTKSAWAPLNDYEAVDACIQDHNGLGFLVLSGPCVYDSSGEFKEWHDTLKGGPSEYSKKNAERGAPKRRRKI